MSIKLNGCSSFDKSIDYNKETQNKGYFVSQD